MIKAILFDFNGVIIDDEKLQMKAYQEALGAEGLQLTEEDYYSALGMDDVTFVRHAAALKGANFSDQQLERIIERKSERHRNLIADDLPLFPGVETFAKAASRHFKIGLVSMSRRADIAHVLARANLEKDFDCIISAEDVKACKPDPDCYNRTFLCLDEQRRASGRTSISPDECLVIEDAPPGIEAGKAAGMHTLGVTNTVSEKELRAAGADVVTRSLADWTVDAVRHVFDR
jgi:phosphoglycolate phosphatase/beta-phosphoglucomutase